MASEQVQQQHPPCPACGGTGQLNQFKGESRFVLTVEECPLCCGFGYVQDVQEEEPSSAGGKPKPQVEP